MDIMVKIILPTKNEEESIGQTIDDVRRVCDCEIIVVDAHSEDRTVEIAREKKVSVIYDHGKGKGDALRTAFLYADDDVVFVDADGTYPIEKIPEFIEALKSHDSVYGEPVKYSKKAMSWEYHIGRRVTKLMFRLLYRTNGNNMSGFRGLRKSAIEKMKLESDGFGIETEIAAKSVRLNLRIKSIPIEYDCRNGNSKFRGIKDSLVVFWALFRYRIVALKVLRSHQ